MSINNGYSHRHAVRADWHHYNDGVYFVTVCCSDMKSTLGTISDETMHVSPLGLIVHETISSIPSHHQNVEVWNYTIMPNHVHLVIRIAGSPYLENKKIEQVNLGCLKAPKHREGRTNYHHNTGLAVAIGTFKAAVTRAARKSLIIDSTNGPIWQRSFHDHIIRTRASFDNIMEYIDNNVSNWCTDCFWKYQM